METTIIKEIKPRVYSLKELENTLRYAINRLRETQVSKICSYQLKKVLRRYGINIHHDYYDVIFDIVNKIPNAYIRRDRVYRLVIVK